jgi:hypothetical protein
MTTFASDQVLCKTASISDHDVGRFEVRACLLTGGPAGGRTAAPAPTATWTAALCDLGWR